MSDNEFSTTIKELDCKLAHKMLKKIAKQLVGIKVDELTTAERNIYQIMEYDFLTAFLGVVEEIK